MMQLRVRTIEAYYRELVRIHALEDLRALDLLVASQSEKRFYETHDALEIVARHGHKALYPDGTVRKIITPEEAARERARLRDYLSNEIEW